MTQIEIRLAIGNNPAYYSPKYQGIVVENIPDIGTKLLPCSFENAMEILN